MDEPVKIGAALKPFASVHFHNVPLNGSDHDANDPARWYVPDTAHDWGDYQRAAAASAQLEAHRKRWVEALSMADVEGCECDRCTALREILAWIGGDNG